MTGAPATSSLTRLGGRLRPLALFLFVCVTHCLVPAATAAGAATSRDLLPLGADLGEAAFERPHEYFRSEAAGGHKSYLVVLGDVAFSSPRLLGGLARQSGMSCGTCHVNGTTNPLLFVPGLSAQPGTFDTTGHLFNSRADDGVLNPLTVPSLRGAHLLAPYGHDGRMLSLRDFVRNVVVNEFSGAEPPAPILDALVAYIEDIDFAPNPRLGAQGRLLQASRRESRGEALFYKPFPHDRTLSCASCHQPADAFIDHRQHDVGTGGLFKTPTLLNANFNGPYFHDGRYTGYEQVIGHFDREFGLHYGARNRADLAAFLQAVGGGTDALIPDDIAVRMKEITDFAGALDTALPGRDGYAATMIIDVLDRELRELAEKFPDRKDPSATGGFAQRMRARAAVQDLVLRMHAVDAAVETGDFAGAGAALATWRAGLPATTAAMQAARRWSLFDRTTHDRHFEGLRAMVQLGSQ